MNDRIVVGFLIYPGVQPLDLTGPMDAFGVANHLAAEAGRPEPYRLLTLGVSREPAVSENGLAMIAERVLHDAPALDTLIIPGGAGARSREQTGPLQSWLRRRAADTRRIASVCTGIYLLAEARLLDGRRATTHWRFAADVSRRYPRIKLDAEALHVDDGPFHTSGGMTAGIDLALHLIEADLGPAAAAEVARYMVVYLRRPGNQAQYSAPLESQCRGQGRLAGLTDWLIQHLDEDLSVDRLADHVAMSTRNFQRVFKAQFGATPARHVQRLRVEHAALLLVSTTDPIKTIARQCGFSNADVLRRAFLARFGVSPTEYQERFPASPVFDWRKSTV